MLEGHDFQPQISFSLTFARIGDKRKFLHFFLAFKIDVGAFYTRPDASKKRKIKEMYRKFLTLVYFHLHLGVFNASNEGASETFGILSMGTAYVIIFKFKIGDICPLPHPW